MPEELVPFPRGVLKDVQELERKHPDVFMRYRNKIKKRVVAIALQHRDIRAAARAAQMILARTDPEPRQTEPPASDRPVAVNIGIITPGTQGDGSKGVQIHLNGEQRG